MTRHTIGIDPGLGGALVWLSPSGRVLGVWDAPVIGTRAKPIAHDGPECCAILQSILRETGGELVAALEDVAKVTRVRGRVIHSTVLWGSRCFWIGLCEGLGIPCRLVGPKKWQKAMHAGLPSSLDTKAKSVWAAQQRWTNKDLDLLPGRCKNPRVDRAEAALIAEWRRMEMGA